MMGTKVRDFAPVFDLSLEELVPKDNFYRRLDETLDLSFVSPTVEVARLRRQQGFVPPELYLHPWAREFQRTTAPTWSRRTNRRPSGLCSKGSLSSATTAPPPYPLGP
jgi:hypothetical protein